MQNTDKSMAKQSLTHLNTIALTNSRENFFC